MIRALFIALFSLSLAMCNGSQSDPSTNTNLPENTNINDQDNVSPTTIMVASPPADGRRPDEQVTPI